MWAHEAFWVYLAAHGGTSAKNDVEKRKHEGPAKDARWLVTRAGLKARETWLALPREERAAYMSATPDASFPADNDSGIMDDRKSGRAAALSVSRFVAAIEATRQEPQASTTANGFTPEESAWIRVQMEPFRRVPLDNPQWRRLLQAFVRHFPNRGRPPTLREYKLHVVRVEEERTAKELRQIERKYPARPTTRNITHEFKVQTKRVDTKAVIKQEQRERRRTPVSVFEDDEVKEEELEEIEEIEDVGRGGEDDDEEEEDTEEEEEMAIPPLVGLPRREGGVMTPHRTRPDEITIIRKLQADVQRHAQEAAQWKAKYEAVTTTAQKLKKQLAQTRKALHTAEQRLQQSQSPAAAATAPAVASVQATSAPQVTATSQSQTAGTLSFVINLHLDRGTLALGVNNI